MLSEYRIERLVGEGGFGLTYLAFDTNLDKSVAIKEYMPSEFSLRQDGTNIVPKSKSNKEIYEWGLKAFVNEAKILAKFESPNIVKIFRFIETNGTAYIVMENCEGGSLNEYLNKDKPMEESQVKNILYPIMQALEKVHEQGVLHRDIKPENIMFRADHTPVLIDFGAAREALNSKSRHLTKIYTPGYAPLEQYSSEGEVGPWSDVYSLAAVAYICLTGKRPDDILNRVNNDPIIKLGQKAGASDFLKSIDKCLAVDHQDRPRTIHDWVKLWNKETVSGFEAATTLQTSKTIVSQDSLNAQPKRISAQTEISLRGNSAIDANTSEFSHIHQRNSNSDSMPLWKKLLIAIPLILASIFGFKYYLDQEAAAQEKVMTQQFEKLLKQKQAKLSDAKSTQKQTLIKDIQKHLRMLGFNSTKTTGNIDSDTKKALQSLRENPNYQEWSFPEDISADLLKSLQAAYNQKDQKDWARALKLNTYEAYLDYQLLHEKGRFFEEADKKIDQVLNRNRRARISRSRASQTENQTQDSAESTDTQTAELDSEAEAAPANLVSAIQRELKRIKFNKIEVNGEQSPETTLAIKAYNSAKNQSTSGTPTEALLVQLEAESRWPGVLPGETFQDCTVCPEMVVIPPGTFIMGSLNGKPHERPRHNVSVKEFSLSTTEITFKQWDACHQSGGCYHKPDDNQWGRNDNPVINVNWHDAQQYVRWLNQKTGKKYRLVTESEWEYAARSGSQTEYPWGNEIGTDKAYCQDCNNTLEFSMTTALSVKSFEANAFGLYDMIGGVWEWVEDCWYSDYQNAPSDGSARENPNCLSYTLRSASPGNKAIEHRVAHRGAAEATRRANSVGFRVAMDM